MCAVCTYGPMCRYTHPYMHMWPEIICLFVCLYFFHQGLSLILQLLTFWPHWPKALRINKFSLSQSWSYRHVPTFYMAAGIWSQLGSLSTSLFGKSRLWWFTHAFLKLHEFHEIEVFKVSILFLGNLDFKNWGASGPQLVASAVPAPLSLSFPSFGNRQSILQTWKWVACSPSPGTRGRTRSWRRSCEAVGWCRVTQGASVLI